VEDCGKGNTLSANSQHTQGHTAMKGSNVGMTTGRVRNIAAALVGACAIGCSSVQMIDGSAPGPVAEAACNVKVFQTYQQAINAGPIDELCVINGTSSGSFKHTIETAIAKHKGKACKCGATNVYIQSQTQSGLDVATVTMVAFRYKQTP
jgi:hypothetical protein